MSNSVRWRGAYACVVAACSAVCGLDTALSRDEPALRVLPLVVHIAEGEAGPVADAEFVRERIAFANRIFAPYHLAFALVGCRRIGAVHARLESRADRDALARYREREVIDWFVVASLRDVDDRTQLRRGVHWRSRRDRSAHYVITSTLGKAGVFAHELAHYLGNPEHSQSAGNLLSYTWTEALPVLDSAQLERLERALRDYVARGELRRVDAQTDAALNEQLARCEATPAGQPRRP